MDIQEQLIKKLEDIVDAMREDYEWGGSECKCGMLMPGVLEWDKIKMKIREEVGVTLGETGKKPVGEEG